MTVLISILLLFLLNGNALSSSYYYIDYVSGSDSNLGTSEEMAFKHCPGDPNATSTSSITVLAPGDTVYFKKGVTYLGQVNIARNGLEVDNGSNGTVTSDGVFTSSGQNFQTTVISGDVVYIYNNSTTGAWIGTVGLFEISSVDSDTSLTLLGFDGAAHSTAELTYRIWRPITFSSKPTWGSGDSVIDGTGLSNTLNYLFRVSGNYLRFKDLKLQNTPFPTGYPGSSCTNTTGAAIWDNGGRVGLIVDGVTFNNVWQCVYVSGGNPGYFVIQDNSAYNVGYIGFVGSGYGPDFIHGNTINECGSCIRGAGAYSLVSNNILTNCNRPTIDACGGHADGIGPFFSPSSDPGTNQYGWIFGNIIRNSVTYIFLEYNNGGTSHWTIADNVVIRDSDVGNTGEAILISTAPNTTVENNVIYSPGTESGFANAIKIGTSSHSSSVINNIIWSNSTTATPAINIPDSESTAEFSISNNFYYFPNNANATHFGWVGVLKNWSDWQTSSGETNSVCCSTNPSISNPDPPYNLTPLPLSPLINSGSTATYQYDLIGTSRPQGSGWDIGAYEYRQLYKNHGSPKSMMSRPPS